MKRHKDCIIWEMFIDAINRNEVIYKYCSKNCQFKCVKEVEYKRRQDEKTNKI